MSGSADRLPNYLLLENPSALIRHGHEYDPYNFSEDYTDVDCIPVHIPEGHYDAPTLGDFITIELIARLPVEYRRVHTPEGILADNVKRSVYKRLLAFEDVRPQSALLPYLLKMPKRGFSDEDVWTTLEPVLHNILDDLHDHPFLHQWLDDRGKRWRPDRMDMARIALKMMSWRKGLSLTEAKALGWVAGQAEASVVGLATREEAVQAGKVRSVICGHTHKPTMEVATTHGGRGTHFFDVGTWRHRIPMAHDESGFSSVQSLTYLIVYESGDSVDASDDELELFDYWSGTIRRSTTEATSPANSVVCLQQGSQAARHADPAGGTAPEAPCT
jgi:UDP-2,3-diacylglucosamine pyrophosphatase LpxH